jgi:hypothetical protein
LGPTTRAYAPHTAELFHSSAFMAATIKSCGVASNEHAPAPVAS